MMISRRGCELELPRHGHLRDWWVEVRQGSLISVDCSGTRMLRAKRSTEKCGQKTMILQVRSGPDIDAKGTLNENTIYTPFTGPE